MNVLVITGDKSFKPGAPRFGLQAEAVRRLDAVYWGPGALFPFIPKGPFDVVTAQDPFFRGILAWFLARRFKATFNVQVHADLSAQNFMRRYIARFLLSRADSIRVVSERLKGQVERILSTIHYPLSTISVLPVFVDIERFRNIRREPNEVPEILWVGRFEDEKDPALALRVFRAVQEKIPTAKLTMLGSGSLEAELRQAARGLPVEFPGWQDTARYLARTHVVLSTSKAESWGASIVEALAAGVPVVALDVGVALEAGATVVSKDELARAVVRALNDGSKGILRLRMYSRETWKEAWVASLSVTHSDPAEFYRKNT